MKKLAIIQSNYIPWKGYFDIIHSVDEFVLYDDVQYSKGSWRNRNQIKIGTDKKWITIPVRKGSTFQSIKDVKVKSDGWCRSHWSTLRQAYRCAPYFKLYEEGFEKCYEKCEGFQLLSEVNFLFIKHICSLLDIHTKISFSMEFELKGDPSERLVNLCKDTNSNLYLSGRAAKTYLNESLFAKGGIELMYMDYSGYRPYPQLSGPFIHEVSIVDLLFNLGTKARQYMISFEEERAAG